MVMDSISIMKDSKALTTYLKILTLEVDMEVERNGSFLLEDLMISLTMMMMMKRMKMTFLEDLDLVVLGTLSLVMIQISTHPDIEKMFTQMIIMDRGFTEMSDIQSFNNQVSVSYAAVSFGSLAFLLSELVERLI